MQETPRLNIVSLVVPQCLTYLHVIHLKLADNFDGNFSSVFLQVAGPIDVAKGTVTHLLQQLPPFQARVPRELAPIGVLLSDQLLEVIIVDPFALSFGQVLVCLSMVRGSMASLGGTILGIGCCRVSFLLLCSRRVAEGGFRCVTRCVSRLFLLLHRLLLVSPPSLFSYCEGYRG